jgi:hypothetical protein
MVLSDELVSITVIYDVLWSHPGGGLDAQMWSRVLDAWLLFWGWWLCHGASPTRHLYWVRDFISCCAVVNLQPGTCTGFETLFSVKPVFPPLPLPNIHTWYRYLFHSLLSCHRDCSHGNSKRSGSRNVTIQILWPRYYKF